MHGYKEAEIIDRLIDALTEIYPLSIENAKQWLAFARTVRTSCEIIEFTAMRSLTLHSKE
jgi:hypothetical protein